MGLFFYYMFPFIMGYKQRIGKFGEKLAKDFLIKHGYKIIGINIKISYQEVDIVAKKNKTIIFIEVKTRTSLSLGSADMALTDTKMENLKKVLENYIYEKKLDENFIRLDLISIDINRLKKLAKIKHYKDII